MNELPLYIGTVSNKDNDTVVVPKICTYALIVSILRSGIPTHF